MKHINVAVAALFTALTLSGEVIAQKLPVVSGTIEEVDASAGEITIEHEAIKNLDMDAMTMVFQVGDPAMLKQVKAGDEVQFTADRVNGQITVTSIKKGK